jgi:hypothetical protein
MALPLPAALHADNKAIGPPLIVPDIHGVSFIFLITRDLEEADVALFKEYGRVITFDYKVYNNVPIQSLPFEYFIIDIREKEGRHYFQQIAPEVLAKFNLVSICHSFQKYDDFHEEVGVANIITKLPAKQAFKADFDRLLMQKKLTKPRVFLSCIKSVLRLVKGDWK